MAVIKKKSNKTTASDLITRINSLAYLLEGQKENDAANDLRIAAKDLEQYTIGSAEFSAAVNLVIEAFEGEHELNAYTFRRDKQEGEWSEADELYLASISVLNLAKRLAK